MKFSIILLSLLIAYSLSINANRLKKKTTSNDAYTIKITPPNGTEEEFIQGKQQFTRESTALTSYNKTIQRDSTLYKQLTDLLPPPEVDSKKKNEVLDFITKQG